MTDAHAEGVAFDVEKDEGWEGLSEFVRIARTELDDRHVVVTKRLDYTALHPEDGVVLVHPESGLNVDSLSNFMRAGGRHLLDDYGSGDQLLRHFGIERVPLRATPGAVASEESEFRSRRTREPTSCRPRSWAGRDESRDRPKARRSFSRPPRSKPHRRRNDARARGRRGARPPSRRR